MVWVGAKLIVYKNIERRINICNGGDEVFVAKLLQLLAVYRGDGTRECLLVFLEHSGHHHLA